MGREIVGFSVFQYEQSIGTEQAVPHYAVGDGLQLWQGVWRIGKNEVELFAAAGQILENVSTDGNGREVLQFVNETADELVMKRILFHRHYTVATAAKQFERNASGSGKKVQGCRSLVKIDIPLQYVEEVLLCKICGGACLE
jgi:hypothetical protein